MPLLEDPTPESGTDCRRHSWTEDLGHSGQGLSLVLFRFAPAAIMPRLDSR